MLLAVGWSCWRKIKLEKMMISKGSHAAAKERNWIAGSWGGRADELRR